MKERYIPEGYELAIDDKNLAIQIYYKESPIVGGLCFVGKEIKPMSASKTVDIDIEDVDDEEITEDND